MIGPQGCKIGYAGLEPPGGDRNRIKATVKRNTAPRFIQLDPIFLFRQINEGRYFKFCLKLNFWPDNLNKDV